MLLNERQFNLVSTAVNDLTPAQLAWVGGYLSGLSLGGNAVANTTQLPLTNHFTPSTQEALAPQERSNLQEVLPPQAAAPEVNVPLPLAQEAVSTTILYGSQTGNGKEVAERLQQQLSTDNLPVKLHSLRDYRPQQLKKEQQIVFVMSTHGNGEPPDDALSFFNFINGKRAPDLSNVSFAVLALGDSSYEEFCQTGVDLDQRLEALGGTRWLPRVDCDIDYQDAAVTWQQAIKDKLVALRSEQSGSIHLSQPVTSSGTATSTASSSTGKAHPAELLASVPLTDPDSDKDVLHLEFSLEDSGLGYKPGDVLAVQVDNDAQLVSDVLTHAGLDAGASVVLKQQTMDLHTALQEKCELTQVTHKQLGDYAELTNNEALKTLARDKTWAIDWLTDADWLDVLLAHPARLQPQAFIDLLRPLQPRQYSIASSPNAHPEEVHLLVKQVQYQHLERQHLGAASNWLARLEEGELANVTIKSNQNFRLPENPDTKIIMIGAGTGVAPYRSFLFEREAEGISGNSWLFFGEQHFRNDFLYQAEWLQHLKNGTLEQMSVAFSRDQQEKIYVQHRLLEEAKAVWQWLEEGAHIYVCGDMNQMAKDVHAALLQIASEQGGKSAEQASDWLDEMLSSRRYQRDVY